jgi:Cu-processing system permease protein
MRIEVLSPGMFQRVVTIAANSYRESVRARILHGLFALAAVTAGYSLIVGAYALRDTLRVVSDLGAASVSLYGLIVSVVIGATSLYREIELKTLFPILARPIRRWEYVLGKFLGTWMTLGVFVCANTGILLSSVAVLSGRSVELVLSIWAALILLLGVTVLKVARFRTFVFLPWALIVFVLGYWLAGTAPNDRQVLATSAALTLCEVAVVSSVATVFAAFSTPFMTAIFTFGVVIVGRSADTLMHLPIRVFGGAIVKAASLVGSIVPNLMVYLPSRSLMVGELPGLSASGYLLRATGHSMGWCIALITLASFVFQRRDFQ